MKSSRIAFTLVLAGALAAGSLLDGSLVAERAQPAQQKEIPFESAGDFLKLPDDIHLGEVAGAATTQKGNLFVYYQGGGPNATIGASRVYINGGARLLEFDRTGKFLREIGNSENDRPVRLPVRAGRQGRSAGQRLDRGPRLQNGRQVRPVRQSPPDAGPQARGGR